MHLSLLKVAFKGLNLLLCISFFISSIHCQLDCIEDTPDYTIYKCPGYQEISYYKHLNRNFTVDIWGAGGGGCGCSCSTGGGSGGFISFYVETLEYYTYSMVIGAGGSGDELVTYDTCMPWPQCYGSSDGMNSSFYTPDGSIVAMGGTSGKNGGTGGSLIINSNITILYAVYGNTGSNLTHNTTNVYCNEDGCYCPNERNVFCPSAYDFLNYPVYPGNGVDAPFLYNGYGKGGRGGTSNCCSSVNNSAGNGESPGAGGGGSFGNNGILNGGKLCDASLNPPRCYCHDYDAFSAKTGFGANGMIIVRYHDANDTSVVTATPTRTSTSTKSNSGSSTITSTSTPTISNSYTCTTSRSYTASVSITSLTQPTDQTTIMYIIIRIILLVIFLCVLFIVMHCILDRIFPMNNNRSVEQIY